MSGEVRTADGRTLSAAEAAAHAGIAGRLSWSSMHWGHLHQDALPHIAMAAVAQARPVIEQEVREQIAAEVTGVALEYRATCDEMRRVALAHEPHDFDADDVTRYGAYASAWESAARKIARGGAR